MSAFFRPCATCIHPINLSRWLPRVIMSRWWLLPTQRPRHPRHITRPPDCIQGPRATQRLLAATNCSSSSILHPERDPRSLTGPSERTWFRRHAQITKLSTPWPVYTVGVTRRAPSRLFQPPATARWMDRKREMQTRIAPDADHLVDPRHELTRSDMCIFWDCVFCQKEAFCSYF